MPEVINLNHALLPPPPPTTVKTQKWKPLAPWHCQWNFISKKCFEAASKNITVKSLLAVATVLISISLYLYLHFFYLKHTHTKTNLYLHQNLPLGLSYRLHFWYLFNFHTSSIWITYLSSHLPTYICIYWSPSISGFICRCLRVCTFVSRCVSRYICVSKRVCTHLTDIAPPTAATTVKIATVRKNSACVWHCRHKLVASI